MQLNAILLGAAALVPVLGAPLVNVQVKPTRPAQGPNIQLNGPISQVGPGPRDLEGRNALVNVQVKPTRPAAGPVTQTGGDIHDVGPGPHHILGRDPLLNIQVKPTRPAQGPNIQLNGSLCPGHPNC